MNARYSRALCAANACSSALAAFSRAPPRSLSALVACCSSAWIRPWYESASRRAVRADVLAFAASLFAWKASNFAAIESSFALFACQQLYPPRLSRPSISHLYLQSQPPSDCNLSEYTNNPPSQINSPATPRITKSSKARTRPFHFTVPEYSPSMPSVRTAPQRSNKPSNKCTRSDAVDAATLNVPTSYYDVAAAFGMAMPRETLLISTRWQTARKT